MNSTLGFREIRSSSSPSPSHSFIQEQRHRFGTAPRQLLYTYDLIALSIGISTKREQVPVRKPLSSSFTKPISIRREIDPGTVFRLIVALLLIGASAGCSFFTLPASEEKLNPNQSYWFHYEAARRGGFLIGTDSTGKSNVKMCAEPAPDVALARAVEVIAKGTYQGATAQAQAKLSEQLAQLAGRTETVLILRESLFRLCELSINSDSSPTELQVLYKMVVEAAVDLAKTELKKAETEQMKTFDSLSPATRQQFAPQ